MEVIEVISFEFVLKEKLQAVLRDEATRPAISVQFENNISYNNISHE